MYIYINVNLYLGWKRILKFSIVHSQKLHTIYKYNIFINKIPYTSQHIG